MNKNFAIVALLVALVAVTLYSFPLVTTRETAKKLSFNSVVCVYKNDEQVGECTHNTMMNTGLNWTRDLIGNAGASGAVNVIGLANGTSAEVATLTDLNARITDCGLQLIAGTYTVQTVSQGNWSISKVFTSTCANEVVNTTGLYNSTAPGTMFAGKNFEASVTLQSSDQLNVTWYVWVS